MRRLLRNLRLIDGTGAPAREGAALLIEGATIVHAGPVAAGDAPSPAEAEILDLGGRTVIPGLVEAHIHLSYNDVKAIADLDLNCPPELSTLRAAKNGELGIRAALRDRPEIVVADEIASRAGAFALAKALRDDTVPFTGVIVILLERKHDAWLARWSGADAWFVRPVDPFELADRVLELVTEKESA